MSVRAKRAAVALLVVLAAGTATSGATYTASSDNVQGFTAAADFGVHVTMNVPGAARRGSITVDATATETSGGSLTNVVIQYSPADADAWTTICTDATPTPYSCPLDTTTLANGLYDFRARATSTSGYTRTSTVVEDRRIDNAAPSVSLVNPPGTWFRGTLTLESTSSDTGGSGIANVRYEYKTTAGSTWSTACTSSSSPYSCSFATTSLTNGTNYDFRAVATDGAGNFTNSSSATSRRPDNAAPSGTLTAPAANLRLTVALAGTASDTHSGVASARMEYSVAGAGSWSTACVDTTSPFSSCSWDTTTVTDGLYDVRTVVTDVAGNTFTPAASTGRRVDNTNPTTALDAVATPLSGTVGLTATASDAGGSGVTGVSFQRSPAGAGSWTEICNDPSSAYTCSWNTTTLPDALYDLRTVATDATSNTGSSTVVTSRRVDNYVPSAVDVQTANGGATAGVIEPGDTMTLTYSEEIDPATLLAGWDGTGSQDVYVVINHHNQGDRVLFYSKAAGNPLVPLAVSPGVNLDQDYVPNSDGTLNGTLARSGNSFVVTLGTVAVGSVHTTAAAVGTMNWFPNSAAKDYLGKATSTAQRAETGASDREF